MTENEVLGRFLKNSAVVSVAAYVKRNAGIIIGFLIICGIIAFRSPVFLTRQNIMNVLRQISSNMYLATSMTLILIAGGIDLSVGSALAVIGVLASSMLKSGMAVPQTIGLCLLVGICIGFVNGFIISRTTLPPFIVTFSMMSILRGVAYVYTGGLTIPVENKGFIALGTGFLGTIPLPVIYMMTILFVVFVLLNKTALGRHIYATGSNEKAALYSGISVQNIRLLVYIFSGIMASVAGMILAARSYSGNPSFGSGAEMDAIAACVLGGRVSMTGGTGFIGGTLLGALIIGVLNNGLNLMQIDSFWQPILKGVVILVAVYADYLKGLKKTGTV
jgi:ribose transport system permease protein